MHVSSDLLFQIQFSRILYKKKKRRKEQNETISFNIEQYNCVISDEYQSFRVTYINK